MKGNVITNTFIFSENTSIKSYAWKNVKRFHSLRSCNVYTSNNENELDTNHNWWVITALRGWMYNWPPPLVLSVWIQNTHTHKIKLNSDKNHSFHANFFFMQYQTITKEQIQWWKIICSKHIIYLQIQRVAVLQQTTLSQHINMNRTSKVYVSCDVHGVTRS